jgi:hypothetical protein
LLSVGAITVMRSSSCDRCEWPLGGLLKSVLGDRSKSLPNGEILLQTLFLSTVSFLVPDISDVLLSRLILLRILVLSSSALQTLLVPEIQRDENQYERH